MASKKIIKEKEDKVKSLSEKMKNAKLVLLTEYKGINVEQVTSLRNAIREVNGEYRVIKNNIIKRALHENSIEDLDQHLEGTTAVIISEDDYLKPSKAIYKFSKDNEFYKIKAGIIDGKVMTAEEIITLAKLPSREELLSKLAGCLLANIGKLAISLEQVKIKKEQA